MTASGTRCIVHIDMDAFYAQVEMKRLGLPREAPLAVVQWSMLLAVNYAARAEGVNRFDSAAEAANKCPHIRLVHVATYKEGESEWRYHDKVDVKTHKVSLDPYRTESAKIFKLFARMAKTVEKASIDEMYADVTHEVDRRYALMPHSHPPRVDWATIVDGASDNHVLGLDALAPEATTVDDVRLAIAATIAKEVRTTLFNELGYTSTAGIAHNKPLAKLVAGVHKPNQQTVIPAASVLDFLKTTPLTKIRFLGGKLGDEVVSTLNVQNAGDLWQFSEAELAQKFGSQSGSWLFNICRGIDDTKVDPKVMVKSMMAAKRLQIKTADDAERWFHILAAELTQRINDDHEFNGRWPKTFTLHYFISGADASRSKSCPFPPFIKNADVLQETIARIAIAQYKSAGQPLPLTYFSIGVVGFSTLTSFEQNAGIKSFFSPALPTSSPQAQTAVDPLSFPDESLFNELSPTLPVIIEDGISPETRASTMHRFFKRKRAVDTEATTYACPHCFKQIPTEEQAEHEDFHVAARMQREWLLTQEPAQTTTKQAPAVPKKVAHSAKGTGRLFFAPAGGKSSS